ncbi:hypothetical protein [Scleromatobacter humisilvae]|uniref:Uncharacterized protein n=1 Tax=Scleromatobacter humisilvae TaxID=2897159 RepID=A0A9X1YJP2_9BURK|nr:hypothetical protein [Scleromatobacter humisilvae]MCK9686038.1 hypothetical protein [Scleromatobacter humisilvae]
MPDARRQRAAQGQSVCGVRVEQRPAFRRSGRCRPEPATVMDSTIDPTEPEARVDGAERGKRDDAPHPTRVRRAGIRPHKSGGSALDWVKAVAMPLVTVAITSIGGYYFTTLSSQRETRESNEHLYAQLLSQREQSDSVIRKDMFGVVISQLLSNVKSGDWASRVLQLELMASNFNESLDLAPLFKDLNRRLVAAKNIDKATLASLRKRLDTSASNVILKQVASLGGRGFQCDNQVGLDPAMSGSPIISEQVPMRQLVPNFEEGKNESAAAAAAAPASAASSALSTCPSSITVPVSAGDKLVGIEAEIVDVDLDQREIEVRLRVKFDDDKQYFDRHFWVGQYDFPMLDNTQLEHGLRAAVVVSDFVVADDPKDRAANSFVNVHLVVFPAGAASLKERQDYDDILTDMLRMKPAHAAKGDSKI